MIEFIVGVLVTSYILGLIFFIYDARPNRGNFLLYILWPIVILTSPITSRIFKHWKYEWKDVPTTEWNPKGKAQYLRPGRTINDSWGWSELWEWIKRKIQ